MKTPLHTLFIILCLTISIIAGQIAHTHGEAQLNIIIEPSSIILEFNSPALNIVGFEHSPTSESEKNAIKMGKQKLMAAANFTFYKPKHILQPEQKVSAQIIKTNASLSNETKQNKKHKNKHNHHHKAPQHSTNANQNVHSEFNLKTVYTRPSNQPISKLSTRLFETFSGLKKINVTIIDGELQNQFTLTKATPHSIIEN